MNVNLLPLPASLSTQIRPPCSSTIFLAMASPRPGAALFLARGVFGLAELFKNVFSICIGDAGPSIGNGNLQCTVRQCYVDAHLARVGELDGIANEVQKDLGDAPLIPHCRRQIGQAP